MPPVWLSEISTRVTPRRRAMPATSPCSAISGFPPRQYLDVAPHEPDDTDSQRLAHRLLGGEARGVVGEAVGEAVAVGALLGAEQARVGPGQTLQQALDARRFGDVDAEAEEQAAGRDVRERGRRSTPPSPSWRGCAAGPR